MKYQTQTSKAGLQRVIDDFVGGENSVLKVPDWIDAPDTEEAILRDQDVVFVLFGQATPPLNKRDQAELAIKTTNAARILLEPVILEAKLDEYTDQVQSGAFNFLMKCHAGIAWLALRNSWGYESINRKQRRGSMSSFMQFAGKHWLPLFVKIRKDKIWFEKE